jgi:hypothetical protein
MWLAREEDRDTYRTYGLEGLFPEQDGVKVCFEKATQQMLFFLDFVDTIEPLKAFYLRDVENPPKTANPRTITLPGSSVSGALC